jgi:hypothetical protein
MPQAIKEFSGYTEGASNVGANTIYTCPANTVSLILPSFTYKCNGGGGSTFAIKWKGSASTGTSNGNLVFMDMSNGDGVSGVALSKYDIEIAIPQDYASRVLFTAGPFSNNRTITTSPFMGGGSNVTNTYDQGLVRAGNTFGAPGSTTSTYNAFGNFKTGPWTMGPGDVLSYTTGTTATLQHFQYTFLILEEAGS